jgi:DNA-binding transcriptional regulator YbjK
MTAAAPTRRRSALPQCRGPSCLLPRRSDGAEQLNKLRRRREIVAAANRLVAHEGIKGVILCAVANATGLMAGAVLYYYDSLDGLFTAVYNRSIERFCRHPERAVGGIEDPAQRIATAVGLGTRRGPTTRRSARCTSSSPSPSATPGAWR